MDFGVNPVRDHRFYEFKFNLIRIKREKIASRCRPKIASKDMELSKVYLSINFFLIIVYAEGMDLFFLYLKCFVKFMIIIYPNL